MAMVQHWVYTLGDDGKLGLKKASDSSSGKPVSVDETTFEVRGHDYPASAQKPVAMIADRVKAFFGKLTRRGDPTCQAESSMQTR